MDLRAVGGEIRAGRKQAGKAAGGAQRRNPGQAAVNPADAGAPPAGDPTPPGAGGRWPRDKPVQGAGAPRQGGFQRRIQRLRRPWRLWSANVPDRLRRRPGSRVVSRPSHPAGCHGHFLAPRQHELHGDGRTLRARAHRDVPEPGAPEFLSEDSQARFSRACTQAPYGYVIPLQKDMTKPTELVRILRVQGIEIGQTTSEVKVGDQTFGAGSYVIKGNQPYWRLAKNFLERQDYPDPAMMTYDDSGWTMGYAFNVDVKAVNDKAILDVTAPLVKEPVVKGTVSGTATAGLAVAHYGSNNMITFRYRLKTVPMRIAEKAFTIDGKDFPAGIVLSSPGRDLTAERTDLRRRGSRA